MAALSLTWKKKIFSQGKLAYREHHCREVKIRGGDLNEVTEGQPNMLSETLKDGLDAYRIGSKIRSLRTAKGLGLAQLGDHTGLSAGMLSKIERGSSFPTLPTLLRIALVFGVGLEHFFSEAETPVLEILRRKDRLKLPDRPDRMPKYFFESLDFPVNDSAIRGYLADFPPGGGWSEPHEHDQDEMIYVISGALALQIHGREHLLEQGDSIYFDARYPHAYRAGGEARCAAVVALAAARD